MHNFVMMLVVASLPISGMLFYLFARRPWEQQPVSVGGSPVRQKVCPTCRRPL